MSTEALSQGYKTFENLDVYNAARDFRQKMYGVAQKLLEFQKYVLADQVRRAALALTNNIAEGHGRFHHLDRIKFMLLARGALEELLDDLNTCQDHSYLPVHEIELLRQESWAVHKLINGYIRFLRGRVQESPEKEQLAQAELRDLFFGLFNSSTRQRFND